MVHKVRAAVQEERIKELFESAKSGDFEKRIIVFMDFKMKKEPERIRETQLQFYGKPGMSWHGSVVFYKPRRNVESNGGEVVAERAAGSSDNANEEHAGDCLQMCFGIILRRMRRSKTKYLSHLSLKHFLLD